MIALLLLLTGCSDRCDAPGAACVAAGTGVPGFGAPGQRATDTDLYWPADVTVAPDGDLWIVDWNNHRIARVVEDGTFEVVSGGGLIGDGPLDGAVSTAHWNHPANLVFRDDGVVVIAAWHNSRVIGFDLAADRVLHLAGDGSRAFSGDGGPALDAAFDLPSGVAYGPDGRLYVTDQANQRIRCIDDGVVETVVGNGERRHAGDGGPALEASMNLEVSQSAHPGGRIVFDGDRLLLADTLNNAVRTVDLGTGTIDTLMGSRAVEDQGDGPREIALFRPRDVAVGPDGAIFVADTLNHCVRRLQDGVVDTVLGVCGEAGDADRGEVLLDQPMGLDVGPDGTLWVADTWNHRVVRVRP